MTLKLPFKKLFFDPEIAAAVGLIMMRAAGDRGIVMCRQLDLKVTGQNKIVIEIDIR